MSVQQPSPQQVDRDAAVVLYYLRVAAYPGREIHGRTQAQIAEALNLTRRRLSLAVQRLRRTDALEVTRPGTDQAPTVSIYRLAPR